MTDDSGQVLDAEYSVETDGGRLAIVLESMSGRAEGRAPRNTEYRSALELLLKRLKARRAVIEAALVDSRRTQLLPEASRSLINGPVNLVDVADVHLLRRRLTNAQTTIGQAPGARLPGNSTKRIRLRLSVPGYGVSDTGRLAADLSNSPSSEAASEPGPSALPPRQPPLGAEAESASGGDRSGRSGHLTDQELKKAIERHAVQMVMHHYQVVERYDVRDVGDRESYDIRATRGTEELHIEVKGSSGVADKVDLTSNEVDHAHGANTHLVIVDQIRWRRLPDGTIETSGGRARRWTAWTAAEEHLTPSRYWYRPPAHADELPLPHHLSWERFA
ncbi:protein NO VEIN domain-containing protein [Micromonospora chalcea]